MDEVSLLWVIAAILVICCLLPLGILVLYGRSGRRDGGDGTEPRRRRLPDGDQQLKQDDESPR